MRRVLLCAIGLASTVACYRSAAKPEIHYYPAENRLVTPGFIGTGDSLLLMVHRTIYADRYAMAVAAESSQAVEKIPVAGATDIATIANLLIAGSEAFRDKPATTTGTADPGETGETESLFGLLNLKTLKIDQMVQKANSELAVGDKDKAIRSARDSVKRAWTRALAVHDSIYARLPERCEAAQKSLAKHLLATPGHAAVLRFLADSANQRAAVSLAGDTLPINLSARADLLFGSPTATLDTATYEAWRKDLDRYGARLRLFALRLAADEAAAKPSTELAGLIEGARSCNAVPTGVEEQLKAIYQAGQALGANNPIQGRLPEGTRSVPVKKRVVAGVDLSLFTARTDDEMQPIETMHSNLALIGMDALRAANTMNVLGRLVKVDSAKSVERIPLGVWYAPARLKLTLARSDRFGEVKVSPIVAVAPPSANGSGSANDSDESDDAPAKDTTKKAAAATTQAPKKTEPIAIVSSPLLQTPAGQPLPTTSVDVLQRYRFRFSVGVTRSFVNANSYSVQTDTVPATPDTLRITGQSPTRWMPMAVLSYAILPMNGQFLAQQSTSWSDASDHFARAGLWTQLGLSLADPLKQLYVGIATDPMPGFTLGAGGHFGYLESANAGLEDGSQIPAGLTPIRKSWHKGFAVSASIDAGVIMSSFGKLVGLK